jgi:hypothetical protein
MDPKTFLSNTINFYTELYGGVVPPPRPLIRLGALNDGGYLVPEDLSEVKYCFSPGVAETADFEMDCARIYGMPVYMCDPTVDRSPLNHPLFHFEKKGIGYGGSAGGLLEPMSQWVYNSGVETNAQLLLQMDIEGAEYDFFLYEKPAFLKKFRYAIIEVHYLHQMLGPSYFETRLLPFIKKVKECFDIIHIHPNNHTVFAEFGGVTLTSCLELTLSNKMISANGESLQNIKHEAPLNYSRHRFDAPNMPEKKDVELPDLSILKTILSQILLGPL